MKLLNNFYYLLTILICMFYVQTSQASGNKSGQFNITFTVTCSCISNGIVYNITDKPCISACQDLRKHDKPITKDQTIEY